MKSILQSVNHDGLHYVCLAFVCPGCETDGHSGLHMLPVNTDTKSPSWKWDGNLIAPTLEPSIRTRMQDDFVCHSFLRAGVFEFLGDCTHALVGQQVPMPDLPEWFVKG